MGQNRYLLLVNDEETEMGVTVDLSWASLRSALHPGLRKRGPTTALELVALLGQVSKHR